MKKHIIAHRANITGASKDCENRIASIINCIKIGFDVEIDVRMYSNSLYLGHDEPQEKLDIEFLKLNAKHLWIHCKCIDSLQSILDHEELNCFYHDVDNFTLTSHNFIWTYPYKPVTSKSIIVATTLEESKKYLDSSVYGICTDFGALLS